MTAPLPIHFFTIVLNGEPFIRYHIEVFRQLSVPWHWHITEGVAELKHDTAWSLKTGGRISDELHQNGLSRDGTSEYLDQLARDFPANITIYRKPPGVFWDGKLEMVNAPLANIQSECLLWQVDSDELWTVDQIHRAHQLFSESPERTAAYYYCHYLVGPHLLIASRDTYGNHPAYEWLRTWRFRPGMRWMAHEPPRLGQLNADRQWQDLAEINPFRHDATEPLGLTFQHFAYVTEQQLSFKQFYYGYQDAVQQWRSLQNETGFPVRLRKYFAWVKDAATVDRVESADLPLLARPNILGHWRFRPSHLAQKPERVLWIRIDAIGDNVLAASMLPYLREKYGFAEITVLCREHVAELYQACPFVDAVIGLDHKRFEKEKRYRKKLTQQLQSKRFDLVLNSTHSRNDVSDILAGISDAPEKIALEADLSNFTAEVRARSQSVYTRLLQTAPSPLPELERHREFLRGIGVEPSDLQPAIWCTKEDEAFAEALFDQHHLQRNRVIALFPCSQLKEKDYPHFATALQPFSDYTILIFGKEETPAVQALVNSLPRGSLNLVGRTTLRQMAACFRRSRLYVGVDSAGAHVACAVGLRNVVLAGGGHFGRFLPYSPLTSLVTLPLDCFGCNWECKFEQAHCVQGIPPDVVSAAIKETLQGPADLPRIFYPQYEEAWLPHFHDPAPKEIGLLLDDKRSRFCPIKTAAKPPVSRDSATVPRREGPVKRWIDALRRRE